MQTSISSVSSGLSSVHCGNKLVCSQTCVMSIINNFQTGSVGRGAFSFLTNFLLCNGKWVGRKKSNFLQYFSCKVKHEDGVKVNKIISLHVFNILKYVY